MKKFMLLPLLLFFASAPSFAGRIDTEIAGQNVLVKLVLDRDNVFTEKVVDALIESPLVNEVVNDWVRPGTAYKGKGFRLEIAENTRGEAGAVISFSLAVSELQNLTVSGNFLSVRGSTGAFKEFHEAILKSKSTLVLTRDRPGRISPLEGEAAILEGDFFSVGHSIHCTPSFDRKEVSICSFEI